MNKFEKKYNPHLEKRKKSSPAKVDDLTKGTINERLARRGTVVFGSMWMFYAFVIYGALGAIFVAQQATLLYWSNWIQLWSLPLLMVGGLVLGKASDKRAQDTYDDASAVLHEALEIQAHLDHQDEQILKLAADLETALKTISALQPPRSTS
jgi:hypothetical protein